MGQQKDWGKMEIGEVESINNLDTARMTLRWALERLRSLEERSATLEKKSREEGHFREKLEEEGAAFKRALALREEEEKWRDDYYQRLRQRIQELITNRLSASPDATATAAREMELARLEEETHRRRLELEKEYSLKTNSMRSEYERLKESLEAQSRNQSEQWAKSEAERQVRFNEFMTQQRSLLESQSRELESEAQRVASWRVQQAAESWDQEKTALLKEANEWKEKAEAYRHRLYEEGRSLDTAKEESLSISRSSDIRLRHLEAERLVLDKETESLKSDAKLWRAKAGEALNQVSGLKTKIVEIETSLKQESANVAEELARRKAAEERALAYERSWPQRHAQLDAIENALLKRFKDIEDEIGRRDMAWKDREDFLRKRDQTWHNRVEEWQSLMEERAESAEKLKAELLSTIREYVKNRKGEKDELRDWRKPDAEN